MRLLSSCESHRDKSHVGAAPSDTSLESRQPLCDAISYQNPSLVPSLLSHQSERAPRLSLFYLLTMFPSTVKRPALGQMAGLGYLYDARKDNFLPASVLNGAPMIEPIVSQIQANVTNTKFSTSESLKDKFEMMNIGDELAASYLARLLRVDGAARYLLETIDTRSLVHETMYYDVSTFHEKLNLHSPEIRNALDFTQLSAGQATHIVTEISWGASTIVAGRRHLENTESRPKIESNLRDALRKLGTPLISVYGEANKQVERQNPEDSFGFTIYTDAIARTDFSTNNFDSTARFIADIHSHISILNGGKGVPLMYTLLPIGFFALFYGAPCAPDVPIGQPGMECQRRFLTLLDELQDAQMVLDSYFHVTVAHRFCLPSSHLEHVTSEVQTCKKRSSELCRNYAQAVKDIRFEKAPSNNISHLLETFIKGPSAPKEIAKLMNLYSEKLDFINSVLQKGGKYIGFGGSSLEAALLKNSYEDAYALYFNEATRKDGTIWTETTTILFDLLQNKSKEALVVIVDMDAQDETLGRPFITHFRNAQIITKDVLEQQKLLADKCIMKYDSMDLDTSFRDVPAQRKMIKIPCPGPHCDPNVPCDWICFKCHAPVEYSSLEQAVYCDCGRCHYNSYSFKCKAKSHSVSYEKYHKNALLRVLEALPTPGELNILILGETGVGKIIIYQRIRQLFDLCYP